MATNETNRPAEDEPTGTPQNAEQNAEQDAELDESSLDSVAGGCFIPPIWIPILSGGDKAP